MDKTIEDIKKATPGTIIPIIKTIDTSLDTVDYFSKLSDYGRKKNSILLESADFIAKYGELSIGTSNPCLKISGRGENFEIISLNEQGAKILSFLGKAFTFCSKVIYKKDKITGILKPQRKSVTEDERIKLKTHIDILRKIAFLFKPTEKPFVPYSGLFGVFAYDFIDQFEDLPPNHDDILKDPDYEFYFVDNLFIYDHKETKLHLIANALITDNKREAIFSRCQKVLGDYEKAMNAPIPKKRQYKQQKQTLSADATRHEYESIVIKLKKNILQGDIFQAVPSRTIITNYNSEPLDIYRHLRKLNPSPYMFYIISDTGILLGSSPEMAIRVQGEKEKTVEIRPIAGTKPRGIINSAIDNDLDSRYEVELKIDEKELAEHAMLVDLARNDIAKVSKPGTRFVDKPFFIEKYSHVQHIVSNVKGILREDLDALHAYLASMNMGTLTGAPKVMAMKLLRECEKTKRGFYGGSVCYITPNKDFDSAIIIRSIRIKNNLAYIRAGAGIVYDSIPKNEFLETEKKAEACLQAIRLAGGVK